MAALSARRLAPLNSTKTPVGCAASRLRSTSAADVSDCQVGTADCVTLMMACGSDGETTCSRAEPGPVVTRSTFHCAGTSTETRPSTTHADSAATGSSAPEPTAANASAVTDNTDVAT